MAASSGTDTRDLHELMTELLEANRHQELVDLVLGVVGSIERDRRELERKLKALERLLPRRKSEKVPPGQLALALLGLANQLPDELRPPEPEPTPTPPRPPKKKGGRKKRRSLPPDLAREIRTRDVAPEQKHCSCGANKKCIGFDVQERIEYKPGHFVVIEERSLKYACGVCENGVVSAPLPNKPIDRGRPGPSLLADLVARKYGDHLPLHRIQLIYAREGIDFPQATLVDWVAATAQILEPIAVAILARALCAGVLQTDDTGVRVLDKEAPKGIKKGHLWVYIGDQLWTAFDFTPDWTADRAREILQQREGYIQADAYKGYDRVFNAPASLALEVGCNAHCRRAFFEAAQVDKRAYIALGYYQKLYAVEREAKKQGLSADDRRALRQQKSKPVFEQFRAWLRDVAPQAPPKSPLGQALGYMVNQWTALRRFLNDGRLEIDNSGAERTLKHVATGRRNWLFCGSDEGGRRAAVIYTVVMTCKAAGVDVRSYIEDVVAKLSSGWKASRIDELLPPIWKNQTLEQLQAEKPAVT